MMMMSPFMYKLQFNFLIVIKYMLDQPLIPQIGF